MTTSTTERVRFTIAVDQDVYEAFAQLAAQSGVSLSRCIGDWLRDTAEAAQMTTMKVIEARQRPQAALEQYIRMGVIPEMERVMESREREATAARGLAGGQAGRTTGAVEARRAARHGPGVSAGAVPPSSNTGGKVPQKGRK